MKILKILTDRIAMSRYATVKITPENANDDTILAYIVSVLGSEKRILDAQCKMHKSIAEMHETNLELVKIRKSWVYKVLEFIKRR